MNVSEMILAISASIGGSAVLLAVLGWLAKSLTSHFLSKDIEVFKANLQNESQREMAQLKSSLELLAFEHQIMFSRLHEKRAEIIAMLYSGIDDLYNVVSDFVRQYPVTDSSRKDQKINDVWESVDAFRKSFNRHKIYFDVDICEKIVWFEKELSHACNS